MYNTSLKPVVPTNSVNSANSISSCGKGPGASINFHIKHQNDCGMVKTTGGKGSVTRVFAKTSCLVNNATRVCGMGLYLKTTTE